jgi:RHS repeat-associated protein
VRQVTKTTAAGGGTPVFKYDLNGNMVDGDGRQVDFDERDRPIRVLMGALTTEFKYGPDGQRHQQKLTGGGAADFSPKTVYYVDKAYELTVWGPGSSSPFELEERTFIGGSVVVLTTKSVTGTVDRRVRYQHVDRLGSVEAVTTEEPPTPELELDGHGFDPWGRPRARDWSPSLDRLHPGGEPGVASTRGFTGHEHLDATYLIHMNGRVYDYRLGRFLSVDPIISNPANSQSINPYSYIGNNPLSGTDPTGYDVCPAGKADQCSGAKPEAPSKPNSMVEARKAGSIAGRGGDNVTINGRDQDVTGSNASKPTARSGADGAGPKATDASNPSRVGAPGTQDQQTPAAGNPSYEPEKWNDGGNRDDGRSIQGNSNCYAYACNQKGPFAGHYGMNPGDASGHPIESESDITAEGIRKRAISDGLSPVPVKGGYRVYLVVDPGSDYHWYREDSNGKWSQKHGSMPVDNVDASGRPITNPERANHNYGRGTNYSQPGGYLWVPPGFQFRGP